MDHIIEHSIAQYGLIAVFLGCLLEGETAALLGGFFAHQQAFALWQTVLAAFCGATLGDTGFFLLGRRFAQHRWVRRLRAQPGFDRADRLLRQHPTLFVLSNRYLYGMRLVSGVAAGLAEIGLARFIVPNMVSAACWAVLFSALGYLFGLGAQQVLGHALHAHQRLWLALALALMVVMGLAALLVHAPRRCTARHHAISA